MTARKIGKVTGIDLVDETSELRVISQFGKTIRIDAKSIRAAGRQHPGRQAPRTPRSRVWADEVLSVSKKSRNSPS
jgi:hypothetical protein